MYPMISFRKEWQVISFEEIAEKRGKTGQSPRNVANHLFLREIYKTASMHHSSNPEYNTKDTEENLDQIYLCRSVGRCRR